MRDARSWKLLLATLGLIGGTATAGCLTLTTSNDGSGGAGGSTANSSASASNAASSSSSSGVIPCSDDLECPKAGQCGKIECVNGVCTPGFAPAGAACVDGKCSGLGECVECVFDPDCPGQGSSCVQNKCVTCTDGVQNGDETGVDCGGNNCKKCTGQLCAVDAECKSAFCADGVCCNGTCSGLCYACNVTGAVGTCTNVPTGQEDPGTCDVTKACTAGGSCLLKNGQACVSNANCVSNKCASGICSP